MSVIETYKSTRTDIDLDLLVYDGDRDYILEFDEDKEIQKTINEIKDNNPVFKSRRHLLKSSLRLTKALAPNLHEIADHCIDILKLKSSIEFFVYQSNKFNAACYPPEEDKLYIIISSGMLENFTKEELLFVVGHEIGHVLFEHFKYPVSHILEVGCNILSPLHAMKLYAWNRNAEISADRAGLLCCGNFEVVAKTFFKLSSGVTSNSLDFKLNEYIKQFVDLEAVMNDSNHDPSDWYSTHPFNPLRIKALELFNKSETLKQFIPSVNAEITEDQMEDEIKKIMSLMEPEYLASDTEFGAKIQKFMFFGGYMISIADGVVEDSEIQALRSIVNQDVFTTSMMTISEHTQDEIIDELQNISKELNVSLSVMQKLNILRDLSIISYSDGEIAKEEVEILHNLSLLLKINTEFIDRILNDAQGIE
ncbi:M48 family metallopeptidase [Flammeovirga pacifica]|uniref:Peptidase M48 n=1 Tax=Flammeovirga pacifica TaxID=915059 RepID=A0A1S1YWK8_FLAPC|nr:M48 family metallopeptidase [Flammeovirga pacifica]OHX65407.1 peptidase M48 [Flammeovirga pacifica]